MAKKKQKKHLTEFQKLFCMYYAETNNGSGSYKRAYKTDKDSVANKNSWRLLRMEHIQKELDRIRKKIQKKHDITIEKLIQKNAEIAFSKMSDIVSITDNGELQLIPDGDLDVLDGISFSKNESSSSSKQGDFTTSSTSISVKRSSRDKALQELARLIGAYDDKTADPTDDKKNAALKLLDSLAKFKRKNAIENNSGQIIEAESKKVQESE